MDDGEGALEGVGLTPEFWHGRRVLVTGHTGFKGAWLSLWLDSLGARVTGLALPPEQEPSLFELLAPWSGSASVFADIRERPAVSRAVAEAEPEVIFHMAAQALVRRSYREPALTFAINVMGTIHLLEAARAISGLKAVVLVTSDKVYLNTGAGEAFREEDRLGGRDPYSSSKACTELVAVAYRQNFFATGGPGLATARAGNVVGGGDWAEDRLVPDFLRALKAGVPLRLRNPQAVRPWQHVLEPLRGYLMLAEKLAGASATVPAALNFGPDGGDARPVAWVAERLGEAWQGAKGWEPDTGANPSEASTLTLDAGLAKEVLGWCPRLTVEEALDWTVAWHKAQQAGEDMRAVSLAQIARYQGLER